MKLLVAIGSISEPENGQELLGKLTRAYPAGAVGATKKSFRMFLPFDDPQAREVLEVLEHEGLRPWVDRSRKRRKGTEYSFQLHREYEPSELDHFGFFHPLPISEIGETYISKTGLIEVVPQAYSAAPERPLQFVGAFGHHLMCSLDVREMCGHERLIGAEFLPLEFKEAGADALREASADSQPESWWEITSGRVMPALSASNDIFDYKGRSIDSEEARGMFWYVLEESYAHAELRYDRADIDSLPEFDVALTLEGQKREDKMIIVSQRFRQACVARGFDVKWIPVRIDD